VIFLLIGFLVPSPVLLGQSAYTETFYLKTNGTGVAPKTVAGAWNLNQVNDPRNWDVDDENDGKLGPNDRLIVLDDNGIIFGKLVIQQSGLPGRPIVIEGEAGRRACVDGKGSGGVTIDLNNKSYIIIQELEIKNTAELSLSGIWIHNNSKNNIIRRCEIHHCGESGVDIGYDPLNTVNCDNNIIEFCDIHYNGDHATHGPSGISFWKCGVRNIARYNYIHCNRRGLSSSDGNGIIFDQVTKGENYAYYNICTDNDGSGINVCASRNIYLYGNVCYGNSLTRGDYGGISITPAGTNIKPKVVMKNNILYANRKYDLIVDYIFGHTIDYNHYGSGKIVLWEGRRDWTFKQLQSNTSYEDHGSSGDPKFVNNVPKAWEDFRLKSDSPCIGTGVNLGILYKNALDPKQTIWPPGLVNQESTGPGWGKGAFVYR
jgi:hypothetical protein